MPWHWKVILAVYGLLYIAAGAIAAIGTQGLFGVQPDGLVAVYLVILGLPWTAALAGLVPMVGQPVFLSQVILLVSPLVNMALIYLACRQRSKGT